MKTCPYCGKQFASYKSWHRHKSITHSTMIVSNVDRGNATRAQYDAHPKTCLQCGIRLSYQQRWARFCGRSCAASHTNAQRDRNKSTAAVRATWRSKLGHLKSDRPLRRAERTTSCAGCGQPFSHRGRRLYCHPACNPAHHAKAQYRTACRFRLNPTTHKDLYDFELIAQCGWYRPANHPAGYNPDGVTWDHLYRVEEGFKNRVDPAIMSHPANAQMVTWRENVGRRTSQLTLVELLERIERWNQISGAMG